MKGFGLNRRDLSRSGAEVSDLEKIFLAYDVRGVVPMSSTRMLPKRSARPLCG